jgi:hypothetical protein
MPKRRFAVRPGVPPHASYLFKHALVQDAVYGTLPREQSSAVGAASSEVWHSC